MKIPAKLIRVTAELVSAMKCSSITIVPTNDDWSIYSMDPSHTVIAYTKFERDLFTDFSKDAAFTIDCAKFINSLKLTESNETSLEISGNRVVLSGNGMKSKIPLLEYEESARKFPDLSPDTLAQVDIELFRKLIKASDATKNDQIKIVIDENGFFASDENDEGVGNTIQVTADECALLEGEAKAYFGTSLFQELIGCIPKDQIVDFCMSTDMPLTMKWSGEHWSAKLLIAPRIVDEEE